MEFLSTKLPQLIRPLLPATNQAPFQVAQESTEPLLPAQELNISLTNQAPPMSRTFLPIRPLHQEFTKQAPIKALLVLDLESTRAEHQEHLASKQELDQASTKQEALAFTKAAPHQEFTKAVRVVLHQVSIKVDQAVQALISPELTKAVAQESTKPVPTKLELTNQDKQAPASPAAIKQELQAFPAPLEQLEPLEPLELLELPTDPVNLPQLTSMARSEVD